MSRFVKLGAILLWFGCVGSGLVACGNDDEAEPPRGPKNFAIGQVSTASRAVTESGASLNVDCDEPLLIWVTPEADPDKDDTQEDDADVLNHRKLEGFLLRPPGDCGTEINCGWIELREVTLPSGASYTTQTDHPFVTAAPQTVLRLEPPDELGHWQPGVWTLRVALVDYQGEPVLTEKNEPLVNEFSVDLVPPEQCPTTS